MNPFDAPAATLTTLSLVESVKKWSPKTRALAILAVLLLLVGGAVGGAIGVYSWKDSQMANLQEQTQNSHKSEVASLKEQVGSKEAVISIKDTELNAKSGEIARLSAVVVTSEARASVAEMALATREVDIVGLQGQIVALSTETSRLAVMLTVTPSPSSTSAAVTAPEPAATLTPSPTITSTAISGSFHGTLPPVGSVCDAAILAVVERANSSWMDFVRKTKAQTEMDFEKGTKLQTELDAPWGEALNDALANVKALRKSLKDWNASLIDLKYQTHKCTVINHIGDNKVVVETDETWEYSALLTCSNGKVTDKLIENYNQQNYRLLIDSDGWRLISWEPGDRTVSDNWQCKR